MIDTTINDKRNMTHEHYLKQPMQAVELKLNLIIARNPHLIKSLIRYINHPLNKKYPHLPLNNY